MESIIKVISRLDAHSQAARRIATVEDNPTLRNPLSPYEPARYALRYLFHFQHLETGKNYLDFTGGAVWPYLNNPGALVIIGVAMPMNGEDVPTLEFLEADLVYSQNGLLTRIAEIRGRYGAGENGGILKVWYGPMSSTQTMAMLRFQEEARNDPKSRGEAAFSVTKPSQYDDPDFYPNMVQAIIENLRPGQKRLTGLNRFKPLEAELSNLTGDDLKTRMEHFPGIMASCHAFAGINPAFNQAEEMGKDDNTISGK